jgi:hypothetical protein
MHRTDEKAGNTALVGKDFGPEQGIWAARGG